MLHVPVLLMLHVLHLACGVLWLFLVLLVLCGNGDSSQKKNHEKNAVE